MKFLSNASPAYIATFALCLLAACGGDDANSADSNNQPDTHADVIGADTESDADSDADIAPGNEGFAEEAFSFKADFGAADGQICFEFRTREAVDCEANSDSWDMMFEKDGRSMAIWTNGGVYGSGEGAALGPMDAEMAGGMQAYSDVPGWFSDSVGGAILANPWQAYDLFGYHGITPNYRVYAVANASATYKLQILSYYGSAGESAHLQIRFAPIDGGEVTELRVDASAGGFGARRDDPANKYTYVDLDRGEVLELSDEDAASNTDWDLGFKRFEVIANSGESGPGETQTALAAEIEGLYGEDTNPIKEAFEALDRAQADALFEGVDSVEGLEFMADKNVPFMINDGEANSWWGMRFGAGGPELFARPEHIYAIRGAQWTSFAKMHVTEVLREGTDISITADFFIQTLPQE